MYPKKTRSNAKWKWNMHKTCTGPKDVTYMYMYMYYKKFLRPKAIITFYLYELMFII